MHIYHTIDSHPLLGDGKPDTEALLAMRELARKWPDARFAAAQCVDLGSRLIGHLKFIAVGPSNSIQCIDRLTLTHWAYYFVGFVNLETGLIEPATETVSNQGQDSGSSNPA